MTAALPPEIQEAFYAAMEAVEELDDTDALSVLNMALAKSIFLRIPVQGQARAVYECQCKLALGVEAAPDAATKGNGRGTYHS